MKEDRVAEQDAPVDMETGVPPRKKKPPREQPPLTPEKAVAIAKATPAWKEPKPDDFIQAMLIYVSKGIPLGDAAVLLTKFGCRCSVDELISAYRRHVLGLPG